MDLNSGPGLKTSGLNWTSLAHQASQPNLLTQWVISFHSILHVIIPG